MNKKGFTLVELLAVIVLLAIVMIIGVTAIGPIIHQSRVSALRLEGMGMVDGAKYALQYETINQKEHLHKIEGTDNSWCYPLSFLYANGFFDKGDGSKDNYYGSVKIELIGNEYFYTFWITNGKIGFKDIKSPDYIIGDEIDAIDDHYFTNCGQSLPELEPDPEPEPEPEPIVYPAPNIDYIKIESKISEELASQNVSVNMLATTVTMEVTDTVGESETVELCITKTNDINSCETWQSVNAVNRKYKLTTSYILGTQYNGSTYNLYGFARYKVRPDKVDNEKSNDYTVYKLCSNKSVIMTMDYNPCRAGNKTEFYKDSYIDNVDCGTASVEYQANEEVCCSKTTNYTIRYENGPTTPIAGRPGLYPTYFAIEQKRSDYDSSYGCAPEDKKGPMLYADQITIPGQTVIVSHSCQEMCAAYCHNPNNQTVSNAVTTSNCWPCSC